jgi:hypothetical protein
MRAPEGRAGPGRRRALAVAAAVAAVCGVAAAPAWADVVTGFTLPGGTAAGHPDSTQLVVTGVQAVGAHPAGTPFLEAKPNGSVERGRTFSAPAVSASQTSSPGASVTLTGLTPWRTYQVAGCFREAPPTFASGCGPAKTTLTGYMSSSDATGVYGTYATVNGLPSAPYPAGKLAFFIGTKDPGNADPRLALTRNGGFSIPARTKAQAVSIAGTFTHLARTTSYWWTACFDTPAEPGIEACAPVRSFTTGVKDPVVPKKDKVKPKIKLKVTGKVKRGGRLKLTVTATDAGGIKKVRIKVGGGKTEALRHKTVKLPQRKATVKILVTVTDKAGNVATLRKTIKVK